MTLTVLAFGSVLLAFSGASSATDGSEDVSTWSAVSHPDTWTEVWNRRFSQQMPNPLAPDFIYKPDPGSFNRYTIRAGQTEQDILGLGLKTKVWGYGNYETAQVTFPGRTFEVRRGIPISVNWENNLVDAGGAPLPHLLPVDPSIMADVFDITGSNDITGVPTAIHHHGGDTAFEFDGGPDQWFVPKRMQIGPGVCEQGPAAPCKVNALQPQQLNYEYQNAQEASLHWYHDHAEGLTRTNVYAGLAGMYVVRDAGEKVLTNINVPLSGGFAKHKIPSGQYEVGLLIQDRAFAANGSLSYGADPAAYPAVPNEIPLESPTHYPEMFGDIVTVNGVAWPNFEVEPREYRLRVLNGADSRVYTLSFGGMQFWQIGTDLGFLNYPVAVTTVTIAPGERLDLVVDFGKVAPQMLAGKQERQVVVSNSAPTPYPDGDVVTQGGDTIMRFNVAKPVNWAVPRTKLAVNSPLRGYPVPYGQAPTPKLAAAVVPKGTQVRRILLGEGSDQYARITPLLGTYDPADPYDPTNPNGPVNATTNLGSRLLHDAPTEVITLARDRKGKIIPKTEVWEFWNASEDSHPIHMHLVQFRILNRQGFEPSATAPIDPASGLPAQIQAIT